MAESEEPLRPSSEPLDPLEAIDDDSPAQVRKTFIFLLASAGVLLLLPRQYVSAGILFAVALGITILHRVRAAQERSKNRRRR